VDNFLSDGEFARRSGDLSLIGSRSGDLSLIGSVYLASSLTIAGFSSFEGSASVDDSTTLSSSLSVTELVVFGKFKALLSYLLLQSSAARSLLEDP
jgi:hypothetical protein